MDAVKVIENAIAEMYRGFFKLHQDKKYQEEYDAMGVILNMLSKDRQNIREKYKVEV